MSVSGLFERPKRDFCFLREPHTHLRVIKHMIISHLTHCFDCKKLVVLYGARLQGSYVRFGQRSRNELAAAVEAKFSFTAVLTPRHKFQSCLRVQLKESPAILSKNRLTQNMTFEVTLDMK